MGLEIFRYSATTAQHQALAACAEAWQTGAQPFWSLKETQEMLHGDSCAVYFAASHADAEAWAGAALVGVTGGLRDLLYLYVPPGQRRAGIGRVLLQYLLQQGVPLILEVRPSNSAALALYLGQGFTEVGRRRAYYSSGEDALVLRHPGVESVCKPS